MSAQIVRMFNLRIVHVPYRGGAPALADLAGGVIAWMTIRPAARVP
jgi:tripartite-type tricarboxylate transporter receptor subunit TctC